MQQSLLLVVLLAIFAQVYIVDHWNPDTLSGMATRQGMLNVRKAELAAEPVEREDPSTLKGKFMVTENRFMKSLKEAVLLRMGRPSRWPSTRELDQDELYTIPGLSIPSEGEGAVARPAQRFLSEVKNGDDDLRRLRDEVLQLVRASAEAEGRVWTIMYDVSGVQGEDVEKYLKEDLLHLLKDLRVTESPSYAHENGSPVLAIWGMGMANDNHSPASLVRLLEWIQAIAPNGLHVFAGSPSHWRTRDGDCDPDPNFSEVWRRVQNISPWYVGRFSDVEGANVFRQRMSEDIDFLQKEDAAYGIHRDYTPVVFPGFSWHNLHGGPSNEIPRQGGTFLYHQLYNALGENVSTVYGAMMDEMDESKSVETEDIAKATALMPAEVDRRKLPQEIPFLALDADGISLPDTWYLRICALAGLALAKHSSLPPRFPLEELQSYSYSGSSASFQGSTVSSSSEPVPERLPPPLPLHRPPPAQFFQAPPALPARHAPVLPPRNVPVARTEERRLPPPLVNGNRPPTQEPPVRRPIPEMSFYDDSPQTRANMEPKPHQATAILNRYIATPENRAQASNLYGKVNDATQQALTRERKDRLAKSVETVGAQGYKLFNNIRKGAKE
ncbi:hypothetical protein QFC20_005181 [Naganishia adeliensis]|uniref:Uncharacterized protein n=1 Tax=Naganishia adeliensis TaxID=92952 RepID=A0ACC2VQE3_9TREE|nr:hypothetical protein QFC20_005181 [Naganishia adeliensis]